MMLSRIALLLVVSRVSGFSSSPGLASRSGDQCVPVCDEDSYETPDGEPGRCSTENALPLPGSTPNYANGANKKVCAIDGFCYYRKGNYCNCDYYAKACDGAPTSSDCSYHGDLVAKGTCPPTISEVGTDFCVGLGTKTKLAAGQWCYEVPKEDDCNNAYVTYTNGPTGEKSFQSCYWDSTKDKCRLYKESGFDVTIFCDPFCEEMATSNDLVSLGDNKCNQGRLDEVGTYSLPQRLEKQSVCEDTYYQPTTDIYQKCEWLAGTARCDPTFWCDEDAIEAGTCNPACNCQAKLSPGCSGAATVMCCNAAACEPCLDLDIEVKASVYP